MRPFFNLDCFFLESGPSCRLSGNWGASVEFLPRHGPRSCGATVRQERTVIAHDNDLTGCPGALKPAENGIIGRTGRAEAYADTPRRHRTTGILAVEKHNIVTAAELYTVAQMIEKGAQCFPIGPQRRRRFSNEAVTVKPIRHTLQFATFRP